MEIATQAMIFLPLLKNEKVDSPPKTITETLMLFIFSANFLPKSGSTFPSRCEIATSSGVNPLHSFPRALEEIVKACHCFAEPDSSAAKRFEDEVDCRYLKCASRFRWFSLRSKDACSSKFLSRNVMNSESQWVGEAMAITPLN